MKTYTAAMKTSFLRERDAFDAAVGAYLARNADASVEMARREVAGIICGTV